MLHAAGHAKQQLAPRYDKMYSILFRVALPLPTRPPIQGAPAAEPNQCDGLSTTARTAEADGAAGGEDAFAWAEASHVLGSSRGDLPRRHLTPRES